MFYRIRIDLAFTNPGAYQGLLNHALGILDQAHTINPHQTNQERGFIITEDCYHDQDPTLPCDITEEYHTD